MNSCCISVFITASYLILSVQACSNGWFGPRCQFLCHCEGNCNSEGDCFENSRCSSGYFGLKCQYKDLASVPDATLVIDPTQHSNWLMDSDDFTCNTNPDFHSVRVNWKKMYPFTWLRIVTLDPSIILNMTISFKTSLTDNSMELQCEQKKVVVTNDKVVDVYCSLNTLIQQVILRNVRSLCSLYISGGFNAALKQTASQSSSYTEVGSLNEFFHASNAVDGNKNSSLMGHSCSHTLPKDLLPTWTLVFDAPVEAKMFILYNRYESPPALNESERLYHFMINTHDEHNNAVLSYRDTSSKAQIIYDIAYSSSTPVSNVQIKVDFSTIKDGHPILTLCEVEIYGECPPGAWGLGCNKKCPSSCPDICHVDTGLCNTVCPSQNDPPSCLRDCDAHKWGLNCASNCSSHCLNQMCDKRNGQCTYGCMGYTDPPYCTIECYDTFYGQDCINKCSSSCVNELCHPTNGVCLYCPIGKTGDDCHDCPPGTYGVNCQFECKHCQLGTKCDPETGNCIFEN